MMRLMFLSVGLLRGQHLSMTAGPLAGKTVVCGRAILLMAFLFCACQLDAGRTTHGTRREKSGLHRGTYQGKVRSLQLMHVGVVEAEKQERSFMPLTFK